MRRALQASPRSFARSCLQSSCVVVTIWKMFIEFINKSLCLDSKDYFVTSRDLRYCLWRKNMKYPHEIVKCSRLFACEVVKMRVICNLNAVSGSECGADLYFRGRPLPSHKRLSHFHLSTRLCCGLNIFQLIHSRVLNLIRMLHHFLTSPISVTTCVIQYRCVICKVLISPKINSIQ